MNDEAGLKKSSLVYLDSKPVLKNELNSYNFGKIVFPTETRKSLIAQFQFIIDRYSSSVPEQFGLKIGTIGTEQSEQRSK